MNAPLADLLRYNRWANLRLLDACRGLSAAHLDGRAPGTSGSIRELLLHLVGGQQTFVLRTEGRQHEGELDRGSAWPGFEALREIAAATSDELVRIAGELDEDVPVDLAFRGKRYRYPKSFFLLHALEHGVEHRTEIKVTMAHLGVDRPDLDGWPYAESAGYGREVG